MKCDGTERLVNMSPARCRAPLKPAAVVTARTSRRPLKPNDIPLKPNDFPLKPNDLSAEAFCQRGAAGGPGSSAGKCRTFGCKCRNVRLQPSQSWPRNVVGANQKVRKCRKCRLQLSDCSVAPEESVQRSGQQRQEQRSGTMGG